MLTLVGKWIATKTYLAASLSKIDFVNIPQSGLALSHATSLSRFHPKCQEVSSCYTGWHPWATAVLEAHSCSQEVVHQQVHEFCLAFLSRQIHGRVAWRLLTPELTPFNIFNTYLNYLDLINMCIADFDKWRFHVWQPVSHSSHWLTVIQEESHLQMSKTRMNSEITCFNKNVLRWWWQRHVQNSSSWTSRKPWRRERDIKHIFKSGNPSTHWLIDSVELDRNGKYQ
jgi:hypothetical protein